MFAYSGDFEIQELLTLATLLLSVMLAGKSKITHLNGIMPLLFGSVQKKLKGCVKKAFVAAVLHKLCVKITYLYRAPCQLFSRGVHVFLNKIRKATEHNKTCSVHKQAIYYMHI